MRYDKLQRREQKTKDELTKVRATLDRLQNDHKHLQSVVESLMHESRRFSAEIASYSEELARTSANITNSRIKELSDTIFYTAGLLSSRMAFSDFELNPQSIRKQLPVRAGIYKKFDKARHILMKEARGKSIQIKFIGNSLIEIETLKAFELVPFVLLDNAVKYSPPSQDITVTFNETDNRNLEVNLCSTGPTLSTEEHQKLFERGMRGNGALLSNIPGEGLGLYLAKYLCDLAGIKLSVAPPQSPNYSLNSVGYSSFNVYMQLKR